MHWLFVFEYWESIELMHRLM